MAKAGFYYSPLKDNDDRALCFACTVTLVCWEPSDSPWTEHGRHSSNCPFIKGDFTENVPLRTTCSIQPGKKIFSTQQAQKWLIKSNEILFNERFLLFLNTDWMIRAVDTTSVIHIKTILSLKSLIEQLTMENNPNEHRFASDDTQMISIEHYDRLTIKRYVNSTLIPLALTMFPLSITNENDNYAVFCLVRVSDSNKCVLLTTTTLNQHENLVSSRASTITNSPQTEESSVTPPTTTESNKTGNKYDYLIEFSNFTQTPKQAYLYHLTSSKMILLINSSDSLHSYGIEYDQISLTLKILFYHCIYQTTKDELDIDQIHSIVLDDEDLLNPEDQSMVSDEEENLGFDEGEEENLDEDYRKMESYPAKTPKRKCFLIHLKSGQLILYDVYRTNTSDDQFGILVDQQTIGMINKCVHIRGTETIYTWTTNDDDAKKVSQDFQRTNLFDVILVEYS